MFDSIVNEIEHVGEQTMMLNIDFLPVHLGSTIKAISGLAKKKKKWNIEILEDEDGKCVTFEDTLQIHVPHMYWKSFVEIFNTEITDGAELNLNSILNEEKKLLEQQLVKSIEDLKDELANAVDSLIVEPPIRKIIEHQGIWYTLFKAKAYKTPDRVLIKGETKSKDIRNLIERLWDAYGDDKGYLELLVEAIKEKQALGSYEVFKEYTFLYGTRMQSRFGGVNLVFETTIDLSFVETESVYVSDKDILDKLEDIKGIKIVRNVVFPVGPTFVPEFFSKLKEIIRDFEDTEYED